MTKLQLAKIRQKVRGLKAKRTTLEYLAMAHHPMVAASLIKRQLRPGDAFCYYLSIPTPQNSWHRYVRKDELEYFRRRSGAWREFVRAMAELEKINKEIPQLLRRIGKGRCEKLEIRRGKVKRSRKQLKKK